MCVNRCSEIFKDCDCAVDHAPWRVRPRNESSNLYIYT